MAKQPVKRKRSLRSLFSRDQFAEIVRATKPLYRDLIDAFKRIGKVEGRQDAFDERLAEVEARPTPADPKEVLRMELESANETLTDLNKKYVASMEKKLAAAKGKR